MDEATFKLYASTIIEPIEHNPLSYERRGDNQHIWSPSVRVKTNGKIVKFMDEATFKLYASTIIEPIEHNPLS